MATVGRFIIVFCILTLSLTASARAKTDSVRCDFTASIETTVEAGEFKGYIVAEDGEFRTYVKGEDGWSEVEFGAWMCDV